jgi:hypothetical protein
MSGDVLVIACKVTDYDAVAETCAAPFYSYPPTSVLPALTLDGAQQIGVAIAVLWALAWSIGRVKRFLETFN